MTSIHLRPTIEQDLPFVLAAERAPENHRFVDQWTQAQHEAAINNTDIRHMIIERLNDRVPAGYLILAGLESPHRSIEFRRVVVIEKGMGYGRLTLRLVKQFAFEQQDAHRLWLDVKDHNTRARQLYQSAGFIEEGTLRECYKTKDGFESLVFMSMLRSEYEGKQ